MSLRVRLLGVLLSMGVFFTAQSAEAKTKLTLTAPSTVTAGATITASGTAAGRKGDRLIVQRRVGRSWRQIATAKRSKRYRIAFRVPLTAPGLTIRVVLRRKARQLAVSKIRRLAVKAPPRSPSGIPAPTTPGTGIPGPVAPSSVPTPGPPGSPPAAAASVALPPTQISSAPAPGEPGQLVYAGDLDVRGGDFVAAGIGPSTPDGFLGRVLAVSRDAGRTTLTTEPAALTDAIADGDIDQLIEAPTIRAQGLTARRGALKCDTGGVSSDLDITPTVSITGRWRGFSLQTAEIKAGLRPKLTISASAGTISCTLSQSFNLPTAQFTIGPIPVVITNKLKVSLTASGSLPGSGTASVTGSLDATGGVRYDQGTYSPIGELKPGLTAQPPTISDAGNLSVKITPALETLLYGVGGPRIALNAGLSLTASRTANPWWTLTAPVSLEAKLTIPALKISSPSFTPISRTFPLAAASGPFDGGGGSGGGGGPTGPTGPGGGTTGPEGDSVLASPVRRRVSGRCALRTNGTAVCWGSTGLAYASPPSGDFSHISTGGLFNCGLRPAGDVACWGYLVNAAPPSGTFRDVSVGNGHGCGIQAGGSIECWGSNNDGESSPPAGAFVSIAARSSRACALRSTGEPVCWGLNVAGANNPPSDQRFTRLAVGDEHTCGLTTTSSIVCWGAAPPMRAPPNESYVDVVAGDNATCGLTQAGSVRCWTQDFDHSDVDSPPEGAFTEINLAGGLACARDATSQVRCWGTDNRGGELMTPNGPYASLANSHDGGCAGNVAGKVRCWGGSTFTEWHPTAPLHGLSAARSEVCGLTDSQAIECNRRIYSAAPPSGTFDEVSVGSGTACARRTGGSLVCWGGPSGRPNPPTGDFIDVASGGPYACGVRVSRVVVCWGSNAAGAAAPPPISDASAIEVGDAHACAIRIDSTVTCWGRNVFGNDWPTGGPWSTVAVGDSFTCVLRSNGVPRCSGQFVGDSNTPATPYTALSPGQGMCGIETTGGGISCWGGRSSGNFIFPAN